MSFFLSCENPTQHYPSVYRKVSGSKDHDAYTMCIVKGEIYTW